MSNWITHNTLLNRAKDPDDHKAWGDFVAYYKGFVQAALRSMEVYESHIDDIVQEVLVKVWRELPNFEIAPDRAKFRSWFSYIIRTTMLNHLRKDKRLSEKHDIYADDAHARWETITENDFEKTIEHEWQLHLTTQAMARVKQLFSGKAIDVFNMSLDGISSEKIAEELELTAASVYKLKGRVRDQLVKEISELRREMEI